MYDQGKKGVITALIVVLAAVCPPLLAQNKQPSNHTSLNTASAVTEGKILWQYNTDG